MLRISHLIGFFLITTSLNLYAENQTSSDISLDLVCNISFRNFANIENSAITKEITLTQIKHKPGGMKLVTQTSNYEFWAMIHGVQTINGQQFVNNFQVAIKQKSSQLFMHALSDTSHTASVRPKHARVSLVNYHPESNMEKGELLFECRHIEQAYTQKN